MANYIVMCHLTGPYPSPQEMETHLSRYAAMRGRVLQTVWWVDYPGSAEQLCGRAKTILNRDDLLVVVEAKTAAWSRRDGPTFGEKPGRAA
jgi:hypothetical protein